MIGVAALLFPKLALGLSGFETGVAVMPLVQRRRRATTPERPRGRIRNTRKLLLTAALIMSVFLIGSSLVTTAAHPAPRPSRRAGEANGRALAYLAHQLLGDGFGTVYDLEHHRHPVVRGRLGHGRPAEPRAALPAALRHGARTGRGPRGRWCSSSPPSPSW